ncbi:MAG TPA: hypothetical protein VGD59_12645 [Acidisarcina sp.]
MRSLQWAAFVLVLVLASGLVLRDVLSRGDRMRVADMQPSAYSSLAAGSSVKAVVHLERVSGASVEATLLRKIDDTSYALPRPGSAARVTAVLNPDASVVMGAPAALVAGAIVQLAGRIDSAHTLHVEQVVILTGYIRIRPDEAR